MNARPATDLVGWLAGLASDGRDGAVERLLGISSGAPPTRRGDELIGHHASGLAPIVHALLDTPLVADDVFVDLGSGLGKVVTLAALLTGARSRGVEVDASLVERARASAARVRADATFTVGDARHADLADGTVFYLYTPFTGTVLSTVLDRLRAVAAHHAIVVCALGIDLDRPWLVPRPLDSFWLTLYDSHIEGVPPRPSRTSPLPPEARALALEHPPTR